MASYQTRLGACLGSLLLTAVLLVVGPAGKPLYAAEAALAAPADSIAGVAAAKPEPDREPPSDDEPAEADDREGKTLEPPDSTGVTTAPAPTTAKAKGNTPQVEVYIPSVAGLAEAARQSKTAGLYRAIAGMFPVSADETGEEFDFTAVVKLLEQIAKWPDTSLVFTTYTQDREGRARWAVRVDWPLDELREQLDSLLETDAAKKLLKDVELREREDGKFQIELPEMVLAVLSECGDGSLLASSDDVRSPDAIFGRDYTGEPPDEAKRAAADSADQPAEKKAKKKTKKKSMLVYCRLNLAGGDDDGQSPFATISGVKDVRYGGSLDQDGLWSEMVVVRWNPLLGVALKAAFKKLKEPFECPREAYAVAAFNVGMAEGLADGLAGLPPGTIGGRASDEASFAAVPGKGFLPFPDIYFQFTTRGQDKIIESIRKAMKKDAIEREEEDRPIAWHEETIDDCPVFWCNPAADGNMGLMPATYRTVVFFDPPRTEKEGELPRLIVAQTPMWADDAVRHWRQLTKSAKSRVAVPDSRKAHWQARISWYRVYDLAQPYLSLLAGLSDDSSPPPPAQELKGSLADSIVDIRIDYGGLQVSSNGPVPIGAAFVPIVTAASLSSTGDVFSEVERERVACRHLRVLYHHAKLFKKDYGRWPATVAELDGYVDFAMHAELLFLRPKKEGFASGLVSMVTGKKERPTAEEDERKIDDSLYVIEWSPDDWKLRFRDGEFVNYRTIYIDADEKIHRVPKESAAAEANAE